MGTRANLSWLTEQQNDEMTKLLDKRDEEIKASRNKEVVLTILDREPFASEGSPGMLALRQVGDTTYFYAKNKANRWVKVPIA